MPAISNLVYAAVLYESAESPEYEKFELGTKADDSDKLIFLFQRPDDTGGKFTLEIFAFEATGEGTTTFSRNDALFRGEKPDCKIEGDKITVDVPIALKVNDLPGLTGTVSLQIKVPEGCSLEIKELKADGTTENATHFAVTGTSPDLTITQNGTGISAGSYPVNFIAKKNGVIVHIFSENINVLPGLCTDTWWNGSVSSEIKDVTQSMSTTLYVRGTGGWYDETSPYNDGETAAASNDNLGSFSSPLATIQKAIDNVIAINDGTSKYTICIDGTLTQIEEARMATFSALKTELTLTIKALSGTATLDGGARFDENGTVKEEGSKQRIINTSHGTNGILNLTLENLVITGGTSTTGNGSGIYINDSTLKMKDCTVEGNAVTGTTCYGGGIYVYSGELTMEGCTISGNASKSSGGGVYVASGILKTEKCVFSGNISNGNGGAIYIYTNAEATMTDDEIKGNKAKSGGGMYVNGGALTMKNCKVEGNIATSYYAGGIGVRYGGTVTMDGGTISGNRVEDSAQYSPTSGGGVSVFHSGSTFTMKGDATISRNILTDTATNRQGGEVYVSSGGTFEMEGGTISGGNAKLGGGVYVAGSASNFKMSGGTITGNTATASGGGVYVEGGTFTMTGGTIGGNSATTQGNGVYVAATSSAMGVFNMSGAAKVAEDNDVYLSKSGSNVATICVAGELSDSTPVPIATITPSTYAAERQVLSADGTNVTAITQDICDKFALTPAPAGASWEIVPNDDGTAGVLLFDSALYVSSGGDDTNGGGTKAKPFATIQKAVDTVIAQNDGTGEYTIYVDGTLTQSAASGNGMADFSALNKNLTLTIKALSGTATLDANQKSRVIYAKPTSGMLNLTLGNLTVTGGQTTGGYPTGNGSGIYFESSGGNFAMSNGTITGNTATNDGGGVCIASGTFTMGGGTISNNTAPHGGGVYISGKFIMNAGEISGNTTQITGGSTGGGVWNDGTFEMNGGTISNNTAGTGGGGVYLKSPGTFTMSGGEIKGNNANMGGGGVYIYSGTFKISDGTITGNTTAGTSKNGVYGTFTQTGGTVQSD